MAESGHVSNKFERTVSEMLIKAGEYDKAVLFNNIFFRHSTYKETESAGKPLFIRMINGNGTEYEVDMVVLGFKQGEIDIIQASIKNRNFESLIPQEVNSAKLLGYYNTNRYYLDQTNLDLSEKQKAMKGEFEHFGNTWIYDHLKDNGKLSGLQKQYLVLKSIEDQSEKDSLIFQDLTLNGIEIISMPELSEFVNDKNEVPITYFSKLIVSDVQRNVIKIINKI